MDSSKPSQSEESKKKLLARLRKVEGQVRGLQRMIEEDRYCVDVLVQIAAARAALNRVGLAVLEKHTRGCVMNAVRLDHGDEAVDELMDVLMRFIQ